MQVDKPSRPDTSENEQRQKLIAYKTTFNGEFGKVVFLDLINKFFFLKPNRLEGYSATEWSLVEKGQRMVIEHILGNSNMDLARFDRMLKGDLND